MNKQISETAVLVSVIVPCRNEFSYIDSFFQSVLAQKLEGIELEVIVADGLSDDGTLSLLDAWSKKDARIKIVNNPLRIVSSGLNAAIDISRGVVVVRMDVHTRYAPDYISECVAALNDSSASCVGGPWYAVGEGDVGAAIATAFNSGFGSGGARSRLVDYSGPVDTVYLGAWRRADLVQLGGFDESLVRNQDDELNLRIVRQGGCVWQSAAIKSTYVPRSSVRRLFLQFFQYGYWKVRVIRKHRLPASWRQLVPFLFIAALLSSFLLAPFHTPAAIVSLCMVGVYLSCVLLASVLACRSSDSKKYLVGMAFACMHFGYGLGFAWGLTDFVFAGKTGHRVTSGLTR